MMAKDEFLQVMAEDDCEDHQDICKIM
jgi:hypothetical protein